VLVTELFTNSLFLQNLVSFIDYMK